MNKVFSVIVVVFIFFGCGNDENKYTEKKDEVISEKSIYLIMKSLTNPFFIEMNEGATKASKEFGFKLEVRSGTNETSIEQQISFVNEAIKNGADAIVIAPADSVKIIPILKKAQNLGLKIVNIDNRIDIESLQKIGMKPLPFISVDNEKGGYLSAKAIIDNSPTNSKAIILEGIRSAKNAMERRDGALKAFKEAGITVVAMESANWKIDEAYNVFKNLYAKHLDVNLLFCANDMMALGVLRYIEENNIQNISIASYDDISDVHKLIQNGKIKATINQRADLQGYFGTKFAYDLIMKRNVPLNKSVEISLIIKK